MTGLGVRPRTSSPRTRLKQAATSASRCRRPAASRCSGSTVVRRAPDARFGSTLPLRGSASSPCFNPPRGDDANDVAMAVVARELAPVPGPRASAGSPCHSQSLSALLAFGGGSTPAGAPSAAVRAASQGWRKQQGPRLLQGGRGTTAVAQAFAAMQAAGDYASPARARRHCPDAKPFGTEEVLTGLSAEELFNEVIRRDRTFGALLYEIKAAYDVFLRSHGASVPEDPIAVVGPGASNVRNLSPSPPPTPPGGVRSDHAQLAVDAARRRWDKEIEDLTARRDDAKECAELDRENAALRKLVKRLRVDLVAESDGKVPEAHRKSTKPLRRPEASWGPPPQKLLAVKAAAPLLATASKLPQPFAPVRSPTGGTESARSESTVSAGGSCEVQAMSPWCSPEAIGTPVREVCKPAYVPGLDLSRISWLIDEDSQEGYCTYDDSQEVTGRAGEAMDSTLHPGEKAETVEDELRP